MQPGPARPLRALLLRRGGGRDCSTCCTIRKEDPPVSDDWYSWGEASVRIYGDPDVTDGNPPAAHAATHGAPLQCDQRAALHLPATKIHQLFPQQSMASGSGLICICRPPAALLPATARRGGAASGQMGVGRERRPAPHPDDGDTTSSSGRWGGGQEFVVEQKGLRERSREARWWPC